MSLNSSLDSVKYQHRMRQTTLLHDLHELKEHATPVRQVFEKVQRTTQLTNDIYDATENDYKAQNMDETRLDANIICECTELISMLTDQVCVFKDSYNEAQFAEKILKHYSKDLDFAFDELEDDAQAIFSSTPNYTFLSGAIDTPETRVERPRVTRQRYATQNAPTTQPSTVDSVAENAEATVEVAVVEMLRVLKNLCARDTRVNYYAFLFEPHDFGKTVENIFHFSFLVRDKVVSITFDERAIPLIQLTSTRDGKASDELAQQAIMSLSYSQWSNICTELQLPSESLFRQHSHSQSVH